MRFRLGLAIGFGVGYYYGAKAGHERYKQINHKLERVRGSDAYRTAEEKAKAAVDLGVERARHLVSSDDDGEDTMASPPAWEPSSHDFP